MFESLFSRVLSPWAFSPVLSTYLLTTRDPEFHRTGVTSWPAGSQKKEMVKGKRPKESQKEPPQESPSVQQSSNATGGVQTSAPKKKKEKPSSGHGALPATPAHPLPIKNAPSSSGTQLMPLQKSPPKIGTKKEQKAKEEDEASSESSQEGELDTSLEEKGNKKKGQVSLATSPPEQVSEGDKEDAMSSESSLPAIGSSAENSPTTSVDLLAEFMGDEKDDSPSLAPDDLPILRGLQSCYTMLHCCARASSLRAQSSTSVPLCKGC